MSGLAYNPTEVLSRTLADFGIKRHVEVAVSLVVILSGVNDYRSIALVMRTVAACFPRLSIEYGGEERLALVKEGRSFSDHRTPRIDVEGDRIICQPKFET